MENPPNSDSVITGYDNDIELANLPSAHFKSPATSSSAKSSRSTPNPYSIEPKNSSPHNPRETSLKPYTVLPNHSKEKVQVGPLHPKYRFADKGDRSSPNNHLPHLTFANRSPTPIPRKTQSPFSSRQLPTPIHQNLFTNANGNADGFNDHSPAPNQHVELWRSEKQQEKAKVADNALNLGELSDSSLPRDDSDQWEDMSRILLEASSTRGLTGEDEEERKDRFRREASQRLEGTFESCSEKKGEEGKWLKKLKWKGKKLN